MAVAGEKPEDDFRREECQHGAENHSGEYKKDSISCHCKRIINSRTGIEQAVGHGGSGNEQA
ncbi:MAG: hypothetical protein D6679_00745 [Candidatus Hydrogenedentota bacterium]|nr:MAG: hypothetical protein D6679_00745 [Candidatus Hydrogenedentota bacterium]